MSFIAAAIGGGASLLSGFLAPGQEQPRQFPELKNNPIMALAMMRSILGAPKFDSSKLPNAPKAPGLPDFAATLARAKTGGTM